MEARRRPEVETYEQYVGDAKASGGARECEEHGTRKREVWFPFFFDLYRFQGSGPVCGGLAQLGERLPCKQEVSGSNPLISIDGGR